MNIRGPHVSLPAPLSESYLLNQGFLLPKSRRAGQAFRDSDSDSDTESVPVRPKSDEGNELGPGASSHERGDLGDAGRPDGLHQRLQTGCRGSSGVGEPGPGNGLERRSSEGQQEATGPDDSEVPTSSHPIPCLSRPPSLAPSLTIYPSPAINAQANNTSRSPLREHADVEMAGRQVPSDTAIGRRGSFDEEIALLGRNLPRRRTRERTPQESIVRLASTHSTTVAAPSADAFKDDSRWRSFDGCYVGFDDEDSQAIGDTVEPHGETVRTGDCVYIVPPGETTEDLPEDGDRHAYWIGMVEDVRARVGRGGIPATVREGMTEVDSQVAVLVSWLYREEDFGYKGAVYSRVRRSLAALGFNTSASTKTGSKMKSRLQRKELISSTHQSVIDVVCIAGTADVLRFDDAATTPAGVFEAIRNPLGRPTWHPDQAGLANFYVRLHWDQHFTRLKNLKIWHPKLNIHCTCKTHYDPSREMVYCFRDREWFHCTCLRQASSIRQLDPRGRTHPAGDAALPADLLALAGQSIRRGGPGGTLAGNYALVARARTLVQDIRNGTDAIGEGWSEELGVARFERDAAEVAKYMKTGTSRADAADDGPLSEGVSYICPSCDAAI